MPTFVLLLMAIIACFYGLIKKKYTIFVFNGIWAVTFLFMWRLHVILSSNTQLMITLMYVFLNFGLFIALLNDYTDRRKYYNTNISPVNENNLLVILLLCTALLLFYFVRLFLITGTFNLAVIRSVAATGDSYLDTVLFYMTAQPLLVAISVLIFYAFYTKQIRKKKTVLFTYGVAVFAYTFTSGGRIFFICLASFILCIFFLKTKNKNNVSFDKKKVIFIFCILFILLTLMTSSRTGGKVSFVQQTIDYFLGSIAHTNAQMNVISNYKTDHYYGTVATAGFLYYPLKLINIVLGLDIPIGNERLLYLQSYSTVNYGDRTLWYNALVCNAFYYYFDSGMLGVILFSLITGLLYGGFECKSIKNTFVSYALFSFGVYALIYTPLGSQYWKTYIPNAMVWVWILSKICIERRGSK